MFLIKPKATRVANLLSMIDGVLQQGSLPHAQAASLLGKFWFLCGTMFGKVGRSCTGPLREYLKGDPISPLPHHHVLTLQLMKLLVQVAKPRKCSVYGSPDPILLYTDASDVPERGASRWVVGAVLIHSGQLYYTHLVVPESIVMNWIPKQTFMGQLELLHVQSPWLRGHTCYDQRKCKFSTSWTMIRQLPDWYAASHQRVTAAPS